MQLQDDGKHPQDTRPNLNVHETFRKRPRCVLSVVCSFNLRPMSSCVQNYREQFSASGRLKVTRGMIVRNACANARPSENNKSK